MPAPCSIPLDPLESCKAAELSPELTEELSVWNCWDHGAREVWPPVPLPCVPLLWWPWDYLEAPCRKCAANRKTITQHPRLEMRRLGETTGPLGVGGGQGILQTNSWSRWALATPSGSSKQELMKSIEEIPQLGAPGAKAPRRMAVLMRSNFIPFLDYALLGWINQGSNHVLCNLVVAVKA